MQTFLSGVANAAVISTPDSTVDVLVIPTNEEEVIAAATCQLVAKNYA